MVKATIVIPTHDHHDLIIRAIASAKRQTVQNFEVFIIGDGIPDQTRALMAQVCDGDERFRFFDNPKGPRTGETYRHHALQEAEGEIVCYLADDDLWLPNHLAIMLEAGRNADFFHSLHVGVRPETGFYFFPSNLEDKVVRDLMCHTLANRFGLSFCGHTLSAYRSLPFGWRTSPDEVPTDLHMWRQFLLEPHIRARTVSQATALSFAASLRKGWSQDQRRQELDHWLNESRKANFPFELNETLLANAAKNYAALDMLATAGLLKVVNKQP